VGLWPEHGRTVQELVRHADAAMYEDKAKGRRSPVAVS
jgi:GGDEF domain-containing protein